MADSWEAAWEASLPKKGSLKLGTEWSNASVLRCEAFADKMKQRTDNALSLYDTTLSRAFQQNAKQNNGFCQAYAFHDAQSMLKSNTLKKSRSS